MPAATLNQFRCELRPRAVMVGEVFYSIGLAPRFVGFLQASSAVQSFGSENVCCPKRELLFFMAARFKLLSV